MKSRLFEIINYEEQDTRNFETICTLNDFQFAYILHDKDVFEEDDYDEENKVLKHKKGDLKAPHYHCLVYFENARHLESVANIFGCEKHMIEVKSSVKKSVEYLIHKNHPDKYQYQMEDVIGTLKSYLEDKTSERDDLVLIFSYIDEQGVAMYSNLVQFCLKQNVWSTFRRNNACINRYVDEHNLYYKKINCETNFWECRK